MPIGFMRLAFAFACAPLFSAVATAQTAPFTTINVQQNTRRAVASTEDGKVFVPNFSSNSVSVINAATWTKTTEVPTGGGPNDARINNTTNKLYTVNNLSSSVTVINTATNAVITTIPLPILAPGLIGLNETTNRIYVAGAGTNQLAVIDGATDTLMPLVAVGDGPNAICINSTTNRIYIVNLNSDNVTVLDGATNMQVPGSPVVVGDGANSCGIDAVNNRVFISNFFANTFSTIDGATNTLVGPDKATGTSPIIGAISNDDNLLVIRNVGSANVSLYTLDTQTPITTVTTGAQPSPVFVDPPARVMYVPNFGAGTVSVIDLHDFAVKQQIPVGTRPVGIAQHFQNYYVVNQIDAFAAGSVSVFTRMNFHHSWDLGDNGRSDIVWRNTSSKATSGWLMNGISATATGSLLGPSDWVPVIRSDLDADGNGDIIWRNTATNETAAWFMNNLLAKPGQANVILGPSPYVPLFSVACDGTRARCILWRDPGSGNVVYWLMSNGIIPTYTQFIYNSGPAWTPLLIGNFDGDLHSDIVWQHSDGTVALWLMRGDSTAGFSMKANSFLIGPGQGWVPEFAGDFDADGRTDIVWRNAASGHTAIWLMNGLVAKAGGTAIILPGAAGWTVTHVRDLDGDSKSDLLWRHSSGATAAWLMNGLVAKPSGTAFLLSDPNWSITHTLDTNNDIKGDLLWRNAVNGWTALWLMNGLSSLQTTILLTDPNWIPLPEE